ncbi:uncharacterized protein P884DRAFT_207299 [Thermothelomyces heterothallicus CBS 202.75]|uniref:uncharacterized protein n=1 Tax=Thermothelomyces heterothallicus CBS 202.75 TaxID=1149848 RepID=UPI00374411B2
MSRTAQLEAKIEDLVTLLRHQAAPAVKTPSLSNTGTNIGTSTPTLSTHSTTTSQSEQGSSHPTPAPGLPLTRPDRGPGKVDAGPSCRSSLPGDVVGPQAPAPPAASAESPSMPSCVYQPNATEAAERLMTFRKYMLIFLPFVHLPATLTSEKLRESHPFLWFSIMTVTCRNVDRRLVMTEAIERFVAQRVVVDHEKSMDLLLGLLAMLGWTHYHLKGDKPKLSVLASLAKSLIYDLGLNKGPYETLISALLRAPTHHSSPRDKTLEERRAVLACFLLTSQVAYTIKRLEALTWTSHMDECLQELSEQREWQGDDLLVAQVKVQLIVERLARNISQSPDGIPPSYVLSSLRTQLQAIKAQLPPHLQQNDTILCHIFYAELAIHDVAMNKPKAGLSGITSEMQRYEAIEGCISAIQGWFDRHFSIPSYVYIGMTFTYWWSMAHCLLTLSKISTLNEPGWNREAVRNRIDLLAVLDQLGIRFDEVSAQLQLETGPTVEEDPFSKFAKLVRTMKTNWAPEVAPAQRNPGPSATTMTDAFLNNSAEGIGMSFFQPSESETWIAGLFDVNWDI